MKLSISIPDKMYYAVMEYGRKYELEGSAVFQKLIATHPDIDMSPPRTVINDGVLYYRADMVEMKLAELRGDNVRRTEVQSTD